MKYTLFGFSQKELIKHNIDLETAAILRYFIDFKDTDKMAKEIVDGKVFYWVKYSAIVDEFPILNIKKDRVYRKLKILVDREILEHWTKKKGGTFSFYSPGKNYIELISDSTVKKPEGYGEKTVGGTVKKPEGYGEKTVTKDPSTKDPSTKDPSTKDPSTKDQKALFYKKDVLIRFLNENNFMMSKERIFVLLEWLEYKKQSKKPYKEIGIKKLIKQWEKYSDDDFESAVNNSMSNNWSGLFPPKQQAKKHQISNNPNMHGF